MAYASTADRSYAVEPPFAENGVPDRGVVGMARMNEPIARKAVLRLLCHEARYVVVGDVTHCGGPFPLAMVWLPVPVGCGHVTGGLATLSS